ncbi:hypothetical protein DIURU_002038 [Diutina rugosa]|uniref:Oxidoreductase-like domain-containing protein n=1 Tax=Diutina rugosa TaxID=5481 RepID=A0A642US17_DIURU|nr:uncharacterized protein DIURU_002038 [Diutina rugosa]KAA8904086.1 hypothetical protein DIURU_002038 [Diutina rugosa]
MSRPVPARAVSRAMRQRFMFYDLVMKTPTHPHHPSDLQVIEHQVGKEKSFSEMTPLERMEKVFGGRIRGDDRQASSRVSRSQPRVIAGVTVPAKPVEPDNCCMSGCINCVWELFNEDVKEWKEKRSEAAKAIKKTGGVWPADFHPPLKELAPENRPKDVEDVEDGVETKDDAWGGVPVAMRVFAETERKIKARAAARRAAQEAAR